MPDSVDPNNLPPELRGVPVDHLPTAIKNVEKAKRRAAELQERQQQQHNQLVKDGQALDLIDAAKRCYASGNSGTEQIAGY